MPGPATLTFQQPWHRRPPNAPLLAITHNPDVFTDMPDRVSLTLAGHTHGGQVALPLIGRPIVPSLHGQRYAAGWIVEENRHLFVTPGLGTNIIPVRFRVPPEISVLTLYPARTLTARASLHFSPPDGRSTQ